MTRTERELEALRRLRRQQRQVSPLRDISDLYDHLRFVQMQQAMSDGAELDYRSIRVPRPRRTS